MTNKRTKNSRQEDLLEVQIIGLGKKIWAGQARWISAVNVAGRFDVLPGHSNFISILTGEPIKIQTPDDEEEKIDLHRSVMQVKENQVTVYAEV